MAWAFARAGWSDAVLFVMLASAVERLMGEFNAQDRGGGGGDD